MTIPTGDIYRKRATNSSYAGLMLVAVGIVTALANASNGLLLAALGIGVILSNIAGSLGAIADQATTTRPGSSPKSRDQCPGYFLTQASTSAPRGRPPATAQARHPSFENQRSHSWVQRIVSKWHMPLFPHASGLLHSMSVGLESI